MWLRRRVIGIPVLVVAVLGAALVAAALFAPDDRDHSAPAKPRARAVEGAGLRLSPPPGWESAKGITPIPGLPSPSPVVLLEPITKTLLVAARLPATTPSLLPAELLRRLTQPPDDPVKVRLGGQLPAYYYRDLALPHVRGRLDVYVAPTADSVVTLACVGAASPLEECSDAVNSVQLTRGASVALDRDSAFDIRLPAEVRRIDDIRETARRSLEQATVSGTQAAAATTVSDAYRYAVQVLDPLVPPGSAGPAQVVAQMEDNAAAYRSVAADLKAADAAALARDRRLALAGEDRLKQLLAVER